MRLENLVVQAETEQGLFIKNVRLHEEIPAWLTHSQYATAYSQLELYIQILEMRLSETQKDVLENRLTSEAEEIQRMTAEEFIEVYLLSKATYAEAEQVVEELKSVVARASIAGLPRSRWFQSNFF